MLNQITIMGRLTTSPELRYTTTQKAVTSFTLAVDRDFSPHDGEKQTDFISCVAWNGTAEFVDKHFKKGDMAVCSGRLQSREYEDKDKTNRRAWEIIVSNVYFGGQKKPKQENDDELPF